MSQKNRENVNVCVPYAPGPAGSGPNCSILSLILLPHLLNKTDGKRRRGEDAVDAELRRSVGAQMAGWGRQLGPVFELEYVQGTRRWASLGGYGIWPSKEHRKGA
jgi:hypothetical protein